MAPTALSSSRLARALPVKWRGEREYDRASNVGRLDRVMIGQTISHYRVVGQLGAGGMGVVYRAEDLRLGRDVALKFVADDFAHDPLAVQRLRAEARAASSLNHANICTIYDIDEHEGHPFIVMELIEGHSLRDRLTSGALKVHQLVDMGIETADALHAAHSEGIIHRDIKPGNIFLTDRGHVKIVDFGLAKLTSFDTVSATTRDAASTAAGVTLGTVSYMSPEQATGEQLDGRTDLFSLGVLMYECATGHHPFPGKTSAVILSAILNRAPLAPIVLNPELPIRLQDVINNCLEKDRELRYQSAADLRADLKRVRRDLESGHSQAVEVVVSPRPDSSAVAAVSGPRSTRSLVRGSPAWRIGVGVALALVVGAGAGLYSLWRSQRVEPVASSESQSVTDVPAGPPVAPGAPAAPEAPSPAITSRLELAAASLEAHTYRAALSYARQVLALDATHVEAAKIRDEASAVLARFDEAIADARRFVTSGDVRGATQALNTAREIDPSAPSVADVASRIAELSRVPELRSNARVGRPPDAEREARGQPPRGQGAAPSLPPPPAATPPPQARGDVPLPSATSPPVPSAPAPSAPAPSTSGVIPAPEPAAPAKPSSSSVAAETTKPRERQQPSSPSAEEDEAAIRQVTATYARAIEGKDLALFRSIKPNLSREEERRLQDGFRAVTSQRVDLTILSIDRRGDEASVVLRRRDTILAGGRQQTTESRQTLTLSRTNAGWKVVDIR